MDKNKRIYDVAGIILCGGKNRRMGGRNKAFLTVEGATMLQTTISLFKGIFREIILVTNNPQEYEEFSGPCRIAQDIIKDRGPLGGIHAGLSFTQQGSAFFVACDMPFLHNDIIRKQIDYSYVRMADAVVPRLGDSIEPLHGIYLTALGKRLEQYLTGQGDYSIRGFLRGIDTAYFDLPDTENMRRVFSNINFPHDAEKIRLHENKVKNMA